MSDPALAALTPYVLVFCRIGTCFIFVPVLSSLRVPMRARLFLALATSLSLTPLVLMGTIRHELPPEPTITAIAAECFIGAAFGLAARVMFSAVHMAGALVALSVGFTGPPGTDDGNGEPQPEIAALISVAALVLMITLDFVGVLLAAFVQSFDAIPLASTTEPGRALDVLTRAAATSVDIAVHISTPFICAGFVINFAFGMVNKLVSQVPVIFISVPFLLAAGLWLLQYSGADLINSAASRLLAPLGGL